MSLLGPALHTKSAFLRDVRRSPPQHEFAYLNEFGDHLKPDLLVLGYCLNDPMSMNATNLVGVERVPYPFEFVFEKTLALLRVAQGDVGHREETKWLQGVH
jgi:hypothetical protein